MTRHRGLFWGLALSALMTLMGGQAQAGTLTVVLTWGAAPTDTLTITGGPFATVSTSSGVESLTFVNSVLNPFLLSHGSDLQFSAGAGASTNQPSANQASGATLISNGTLNVDTAATGSTTMTITAFLSDYNTPIGTAGTLSSTASATFTNTAAGDSEAFQSWYNANNVPGAMTLPSGLTTAVSTGASTNSGVLTPPTGTQTVPITSFATPFSLTNQMVVSLTPTGLTSESAQYQGSTLVTANGVPEPSSIIMMLTAIPVPLIVVGMLRRRKAAVAKG